MLEAVAWVHIERGSLLAVRTRGRDVYYLPGGKLEPGETGPQALARELAEELGLVAAPDELTELFTVEDEAHGHDGRRVRMTCYTGPGAGTPSPAREIAELAWLTGADADRCAPALRQVLTRLVTARAIQG